jgi:hypothetical protein
MKSLRKRNPMIFDLILFIAFTLAAFGAFALSDAAGASGALIAIAILSAVSILLVVSR